MSLFRKTASSGSVKQGHAVLAFTANAEIIDLGRAFTHQAQIARGALAADSPAIGTNKAGAAVGAPLAIDAADGGIGYELELLASLQKGGCWVSLGADSDMPLVGILADEYDKVDLSFVRHHPNIIWIGHEPRYIERPIKNPLIIPGLARYYFNHRNLQDLWELCGESDNANLTPTTGVSAFYVNLEFSPVKHGVLWQRAKPTVSIRTNSIITHAAQDSGNERHILWPTFVFPTGMGQYAQAAQGWANCAIGQWRIYCGLHGVGSGPTTLPFGLTNWTDWGGKRVGNKVWFYLDIQSDGVGDGTLTTDSMLSVTGCEV